MRGSLCPPSSSAHHPITPAHQPTMPAHYSTTTAQVQAGSVDDLIELGPDQPLIVSHTGFVRILCAAPTRSFMPQQRLGSGLSSWEAMDASLATAATGHTMVVATEATGAEASPAAPTFSSILSGAGSSLMF